jgi:hypothetical protein
LCEKIDPFFFPQTIPDTVSHRDHCHQKLKNGEASLAQNDRLLSNQQLAQRVVTLLRKRNSELQSLAKDNPDLSRADAIKSPVRQILLNEDGRVRNVETVAQAPGIRPLRR